MTEVQSLRQWYLETFAGGKNIEGKALRNHILSTLHHLQRLEVSS